MKKKIAASKTRPLEDHKISNDDDDELIKKGPWTAEEDELLMNYMITTKHGHAGWRTLPEKAGLRRCGKSCRLRWMNYLRPNVKRGYISPAEEDLILRLHRLLGNRWSLIAGRIPGRTDNEIKNYWNTYLSKKLIREGINPRTHKPLISGETPFGIMGAVKLHKSTKNPNLAGKGNQHQCESYDHHPGVLISNGSEYSSPIEENNVNQEEGGLVRDNTHDDHLYEVDNNGDRDDDDDVISSFLNSLINDDDMIFP